jgi:molecular chaperone GrpE
MTESSKVEDGVWPEQPAMEAEQPVVDAEPPAVDGEQPTVDAQQVVEDEAAVEGIAATAAEPEPELDHEQRVHRDLAELEAKAQKADEYLELAQRTRADFENFRKRASRDVAVAQERGVAKLAKELLPAVDNLDRALSAAESSGPGAVADETLAAGVKLVHAELLGALARAGIEPFSPHGEAFDPQCHEAMAQTPVEGATPGTVVEVYQRGYRLGETVLRPARVVVAG